MSALVSFHDAMTGIRVPRPSPARPSHPAEVELPTGTVTFLLTDIEGSTRLWETVPDAMKAALVLRQRVVVRVIQALGGVVVRSRGEGDRFVGVFPSAA